MPVNQTTVGNKRKRVLTPPVKKEPSSEDAYVTPRGGEFAIKYDGMYGLFKIVTTTGGPLPKDLAGRFTEKFRAEQAIERYMDNYWKGRK